MIDPLHFVHNQVVPPVVIEQLRTETDTTLSATQVTSLSTSDRFEIDYTALSYQAPDQVHFRYKLRGLMKIGSMSARGVQHITTNSLLVDTLFVSQPATMISNGMNKARPLHSKSCRRFGCRGGFELG